MLPWRLHDSLRNHLRQQDRPAPGAFPRAGGMPVPLMLPFGAGWQCLRLGTNGRYHSIIQLILAYIDVLPQPRDMHSRHRRWGTTDE